MIKVKETDEVLFRLPDPNTIPCLNCKWGCIDYLAIRCVKYPDCKPYSVYYDSEPCEKFEELK